MPWLTKVVPTKSFETGAVGVDRRSVPPPDLMKFIAPVRRALMFIVPWFVKT